MTSIEASALTRRELFRHAGGAAALVAAARLPRPRAETRARQGLPTLAEVLPHVGSRFDVLVAPGRWERLTLLEAAGHGGRGQGRGVVTGEAFSLLFGEASAALPAGTHAFHQRALGSFPLFVTPVGQGRNGQRYEAIVNQHAPAR